MVFGCNDTRVADVAVQIALKHRHCALLFCGGVGRLSKDIFERSEAEIFADSARKAGIHSSRIWLEKTSTNTGENIQFAKPILTANNLTIQRPFLVCKNIMRARVWATFERHYPNLPTQLFSLCATFERFCELDAESPSLSSIDHRESVIHLMVGEIDRLIHYPQKGYIYPVPLPQAVIESAEYLKQQGYIKHSLNNQ